MGCAKYVECADCDYEAYVRDGVRRLQEVSVPCELSIARHFGKDLRYPYMDPEVLEVVAGIDVWDMRPATMDSRKSVLKEAAAELGFPGLARRTKKSSQYGSGTTDIIRSLARSRGLMYNRYIAELYREVFPEGRRRPLQPRSGDGGAVPGVNAVKTSRHLYYRTCLSLIKGYGVTHVC